MYKFLSLSRDEFKNTLLAPLCEVHKFFLTQLKAKLCQALSLTL
jgi:hypothetical protein